MLIAFISSFTFFLTIVIGNLVGAGLPILADKVGMDGAIFAGPIQTTILDIVTTIIYFSLTTAIFVPLAQHGYFS
jgi:magnesium transporter